MRESVREREKKRRWVWDNGIAKQQYVKRESLKNKGSTSYFFTNFPENLSYEDLWRVLHKWGRVIDVCIPPKRDKFGKKFGFVRFLDVQQPKVLEQKLDALWIGTYKLRVNIPAFERSDERVPVSKQKVINEGIQSVAGSSAGVSYAKAVVGGAFNGQSRRYESRPIKHYNNKVFQKSYRKCEMEYNVNDTDMSWLKECFVGKTRDPEGINCIINSHGR